MLKSRIESLQARKLIPGPGAHSNSETHHHKSSISRSSSPISGAQGNRKKEKHVSAFKKRICGDIFGTSMSGDNSMLGMLYRSRIQESLHSSASDTMRDERSEEASQSILLSSDSIVGDSSDSENDFTEAMNPRQRLALTIRNWSKTSENDAHLLKEGAIHAIVALAGTDDHRIKLYCASTLFHLSSRPQNREELLAVGGATGAITIAKTVQHWKIAKLCSLTLRNLSFHDGGEDTMAKEGAMFAIKCLLGIRNQRLAPVCVQALYNLTCVNEYFKEMERIIKALLTLPSLSTFDATPYVVKSLVNCSRFAPLRVRIVEDGALQTFAAFVQSFGHRENAITREELVFYMATCVRQLSDTVTCRVDMLSKGCVELIYQLLPHCEAEKTQLLLIKTIHNLLSVIQTFPMIIFEIAVNIVIDMIFNTKNDLILQYASSCLYLFTTQETMKSAPRLSYRILKALPKLLLSNDTLTQFFSVATSSNMFFGDLCDEHIQLEALLKKFVEAGDHIQDAAAVRAMVVAIARLAEDSRYLGIIADNGLLDKLLDTLLSRVKEPAVTTLVKEACCVSICRIVLAKEDLDAARAEDISSILKSMLHLDISLPALQNTISGIRALDEQGICHKFLLSDALIERVAQIAMKYKHNTDLCRLCCAVLAVLSYDVSSNNGLSSDAVMNVLFAITRCDDVLTREYVATCICNISINVESSKKMLQNSVIEVVSSLSGATSERIQELCAKCICNLTCVTEMHPMMIKNKILQTILMISLVRSVSELTRRLCARSLLNMLTEENLTLMLDAGVIRAFANLSLINDRHTHHICARAFLIFTTHLRGREEICNRRSVLHALLGLVKGESMKTKIILGKAVCNILSCADNRKAAIVGGTLSVLKIISTFEVEELRERVAMVLIVMAKEPTLYDYLLREPIVPILVLILKESTALAFECAIFALACLSEIDKFRDLLINKGCVTSIVNAILSGKVNSIRIAEEVCRCFCYISFTNHETDVIVNQGNMLLGLHAVHRKGLCSKGAAEMITIILRNLTATASVRPIVVEQDGVKLLRNLMEEYSLKSPAMCKAAVLVMSNLGEDGSLHRAIIQQGMMTMLSKMADRIGTMHREEESDELDEEGQRSILDEVPVSSPFRATSSSQQKRLRPLPNADTFTSTMNRKKTYDRSEKPFLSQHTMQNMITAIELISRSTDCHLDVVKGDAINIFTRLMSHVDDSGKFQMACSIANLASTKNCRDLLVSQNAVDLLIALARTPFLQTRTQCSSALGYLSENTKVQRSNVASLLYLAYRTEETGQGLSTTTQSDLEGPLDVSKSDVPSAKLKKSASTRDLLSQQNGGGGTQNANTKSVSAMIREGLLRNQDEHDVSFEDFIPSRSKTYQLNSYEDDMSVTTSTTSAELHSSSSLMVNFSNFNSNSMTGSGMNTQESLYGLQSNQQENGASSQPSQMPVTHRPNAAMLHHAASVFNLDENSISTIETLQGALQDEHDIYPEYQYKLSLHSTNQESGGMAKKMKVDLPYPTLSIQESLVEAADRIRDVMEVPIIMATIPKDMTSFDVSRQSSSGSVILDNDAISDNNLQETPGNLSASSLNESKDAAKLLSMKSERIIKRNLPRRLSGGLLNNTSPPKKPIALRVTAMSRQNSTRTGTPPNSSPLSASRPNR